MKHVKNKKNKLTNSYLGGGQLKTKAFTLIELLAIIVILAIIAVITVPIILGVIDNAKRGSVIDSAYGYKDAVDKFYFTKLSEDASFEFNDGTYLVSELKGIGITVSGNEPTGDSWVVIKDNQVYDFSLKLDDYIVNYDVDTNEVSAIKNGTIELTPEAQAEKDRIDNIKRIVSAYIYEAKTKNSSLDSETAKLVSDMTDVVMENGPVEGWVHFDVTDDGEVVIKDYSLKVDNYVADYSEDITVTKNGSIRTMPIVRTVVRTIDDVGYYNTEWIGTNPVYYNPVTGESCTSTDYHEDNSKTGYNGITTNGEVSNNTSNNNGCLKWYAYSEQNGNVNLLLDHNTTASVMWYNNQLLGKLQSDTSDWSDKLKRNDSYSIKIEPNGYQIDYSEYKARLITAQEVAYIAGNESWVGRTADNYFYFDSKTSIKSPTCKIGDTSGCSYGWLYDRTTTWCTSYGCLNNSDEGNFGYWTATPNSTSYYYTYGAWLVSENSDISFYSGIISGPTNVSSGARPVITVSKSTIFES